jgi:hypothetical protein
MQIGPYHRPISWASGVWSLRIFESAKDFFVQIPTLSTIIRVESNAKDFNHALSREMLASSQNTRQVDKFGKITSLLGRKKPEALEERNDLLDEIFEIVDLEVPDAIRTLSRCSALEVRLEDLQDGALALRDVETQRHFPGKHVIAPRTERNVEASFAIGKPREVITNGVWNRRYIEHRFESFLLIARTPRVVTALTVGRVPGDTPGFPAYSQILFSELQVGLTVYSYGRH